MRKLLMIYVNEKQTKDQSFKNSVQASPKFKPGTLKCFIELS